MAGNLDPMIDDDNNTGTDRNTFDINKITLFKQLIQLSSTPILRKAFTTTKGTFSIVSLIIQWIHFT